MFVKNALNTGFTPNYVRVTYVFMSKDKKKYDVQAELDRLGVSQTEFAKITGVSIRSVQYWVAGEKEPSNLAKFIFEITRRNPDMKQSIIESARQVMQETEKRQ